MYQPPSNSIKAYLFSGDLDFELDNYIPNTEFNAEKKLLCAILIRTIYDIEHYLQLQPPERSIAAFKIARDAFNYIHDQAHYKAYSRFPFSFSYLGEQLFNHSNAIEIQKIRLKYPSLPLPFQPHHSDGLWPRPKQFKIKRVQYSASRLP